MSYKNHWMRDVEAIIRREKQELIGKFLERLDWVLERIEFHTENPDSELMDEITEEYKKWEAKLK